MLAPIVCLAASALVATAQQDPGRVSIGEGPLDNNAFLPAHEVATNSLAAADKRFAELAGSAVDDSNRRAWLEVVDALHVALRDSSTGDMVAPLPQSGGGLSEGAWADVDGTSDAKLDRRRDGVEAAVQRRLVLAPNSVRALWRERFDGAGRSALAEARSDHAELRRVERTFACTFAGFGAALMLCDAEFERGALLAARRWLERAEFHARWAKLETAAPSLARRREWIDAQRTSDAAANEPQAWTVATSMRAVGAVAIDDGRLARARASMEVAVGLRPGLCFLDGDRAVVQVPSLGVGVGADSVDRVALIDVAAARRLTVVAPLRLLEPYGVQLGWIDAPIEPPGWPLLPASDGRGVITTLGRRGSEHGNALICFDFESLSGSAEPPSAVLRWAWYDGALIHAPASARGTRHDLGVGVPLDWGAVEFQPGAVVADGAVFVAVREFVGVADPAAESLGRADSSTEINTWVAALDVESGALRWRTKLGKGVEIQRSRGRFFSPLVPTSSVQPLAWLDGRLWAGSHTGFGGLVDASDGRVEYALRNRRRNSERRTWTGGRPPVDELDRTVLWAPADSDHLYWLRGAPDLDGLGVMQHAPRAISEGEILVGGDHAGALVLSRLGAERALVRWDAASGRTIAAPELGPSETFGGEGVSSRSRVWFASTRGLYLADRERELFLLDYGRLDPPPGAATLRGGSVFARDAWVCVVSQTTTWVFQVQR